MGGSTGLVVMGGDSSSEGRAFEYQLHILDGHFYTFICCKNCNGCMKMTEVKEKRPRMAHFFKKDLN